MEDTVERSWGGAASPTTETDCGSQTACIGEECRESAMPSLSGTTCLGAKSANGQSVVTLEVGGVAAEEK